MADLSDRPGVDPVRELGRLLRDVGYVGRDTSRDRDVAVAQRRLERPSALATLVDLFALGARVPGREARAALAPIDPDAIAAEGLLERDGDDVSAPLGVAVWDELLLLFDRPPPTRPDHVTGVNAAAQTLASLTVRRRVEHAFDLGTGCGIQAFAAARHADAVVATDVNRRALWTAKLNSRLNEIVNVELREGSLYEPVAGQSFDLVVANPPFVISPEPEFAYRDSGRGDELSRSVVRGAAASLRDGGFATVLCNWALAEDEDWRVPVLRWVEETGCDAWILLYETDDPLAYAARWNPYLSGDDYAAALDRWSAHHRRGAIAAVALGAVILRRREAAAHWAHAEEAGVAPSASASAQILRVFANRDAAGRWRSDEALLREAVALVEPHRLDQVLAFRDGAYSTHGVALTPAAGVGVQAKVAPESLHALFRLGVSRRLDDVVREAAEDTGLEEASVRAATVAAARRLLETGIATLTADA